MLCAERCERYIAHGHVNGACRLAILAIGFCIALPSIAEVNTTCILNSDGAAQTRLLAYEIANERSAAGSAQPSSAPVNEAELRPAKVDPNALTAYTPKDLQDRSPEVLRDWTRWPATKFTDTKGVVYEFMGVHLTNKNPAPKPPCLMLTFRVFAPVVEERDGPRYLVSKYEDSPEKFKLISLSKALRNPIAWDSTQQFYVIDLARLRKSDSIKRRYDTYLKNIANARDPKAPPVYMERLLFNFIRQARYAAPQLERDELAKFRIAAARAVQQRYQVDCNGSGLNTSAVAACILNGAFMETELGAYNPLSVSDALDNSGLAFGPRQLDLGQGRQDALQFAKRYLVDGTSESERNWPQRFFKPLEKMTLSELKELYAGAVDTFNDRLAASNKQVLALYVDGITLMVGSDYKLGNLRFSGKADLLALVIASDFSNKWGMGRTQSVVGHLASKRTLLDECGVLTSWREAVRSQLGPADRIDFERRSAHVVNQFTRHTKVSLAGCRT